MTFAIVIGAALVAVAILAGAGYVGMTAAGRSLAEKRWRHMTMAGR